MNLIWQQKTTKYC